jgi:hypothetical protein
MELNYVLLFIIGFMLGGISLFIYHYKKINNLRADITDKRIINQLIKDYVDKLPKGSNSRKRRYNGKQKTKKTKTTSRQNAKQSG